MLSFVQRLQVEQVPCVYQHWYGEENGRIVWNDKSLAEARNCMELYYLRNLSCQTEVQNDSECHGFAELRNPLLSSLAEWDLDPNVHWDPSARSGHRFWTHHLDAKYPPDKPKMSRLCCKNYCENMFNGLTNEKMHKNARRDHKSIQRPLKGPRHKSHKLLEVKHMTGHWHPGLFPWKALAHAEDHMRKPVFQPLPISEIKRSRFTKQRETANPVMALGFCSKCFQGLLPSWQFHQFYFFQLVGLSPSHFSNASIPPCHSWVFTSLSNHSTASSLEAQSRTSANSDSSSHGMPPENTG